MIDILAPTADSAIETTCTGNRWVIAALYSTIHPLVPNWNLLLQHCSEFLVQ